VSLKTSSISWCEWASNWAIWRWLRWCKKKLLVELEQSAEVRRLATALATRQTPDFEAWESLLLQAARQGGAGVLGSLLTHWQQHGSKEVILCQCGQRMSSRGRRAKRLLTTLGRVPFARSFYQCQQCRQGCYPDDEHLDIIKTTYSPGVRRLMARAGSQTQFEQAAQDLHCYAGLELEAREIERVAEEVGRQVEAWLSDQQEQMLQTGPEVSCALEPDAKLYISFDGTGVPVRKNELLGRQAGRRFGSHTRSQARLRLHSSGIGQRRVPSTGCGLYHLRRGH